MEKNKNKVGKPRGVKNTLTREALEKFPNKSKKAIAKYLHDKHPLLFKDVEDARAFINKITLRDNDKIDRSHLEFSPFNPYGIPVVKKTEKESKEPVYRIPKVNNRILWLSDIHIPNHDIDAVTAAINYGKEKKANCIVLGGDVLDNTPFTHFLRPNFDKNDVKDWFEMAEQFIEILKKEFPNALIIWIEGNHDKWYEKYLMTKAPMLFDDEYYQLDTRLKLKEKGVVYLPEEIICKAGKLDLLHGHTIVKGVFAPVNAARGAFNKAKSSLLIGHCHQTSEHTEANLKKEIITCFSTGCLCSLSPKYDPHNTKHNHGFAFIEVGDKGHFKVSNKRIYNGEVL